MLKITFKDKIPARKDIAVVQLDAKTDNQVLVSGGRKKIVVNTGKPETMHLRKFMLLPRRVIVQAKSLKSKKVAINFKDFRFAKLELSDEQLAEILAVNFELANYEYVQYKTPPKNGWNFVEEIYVIGKFSNEVKNAFSRGLVVGAEVNTCRSLSNSPGGDMTPRILAQEAVGAAKAAGVKAQVLGLSDIKKLKMGGILGVSQGSVEEPKFIILEYLKGPKDQKPIVLIGKGITFDTGGINLKPSEHIGEMQMDMSGGAAVIHAIVAAAKLKIAKNIVALIPAAENMPSGSSYRPGDILKSMSGKTIEIQNTDAEGRVVLADALEYSRRYNPRLVVDVATLTGAAAVALGQRLSALFTKDKDLEDLFRLLGDESGDHVWPLPLWEEHEEEVKGTFGDIATAQKTRWGGAIQGAAFLAHFAKGLPWVHIDIAPRMTSVQGEFLAQGSVGSPVRLLVKLLEKY